MHTTKTGLVGRFGSLHTLTGWIGSGLGHGQDVRVRLGYFLLFRAGSGQVSAMARILGLVRVGFWPYVVPRVNTGRAFCY